MQTTIRTTIRIRKDLLDQSRMLALHKGVSLQDIINEALALGYKHVSDLHMGKDAMKQIDNFRQRMVKKNIDLNKLIIASKSDQK
ncbi:MAG: hypothetical protein HYV40_05615 [Candidatus Levybacteria bacterium]|nr:hypothetical protein [Candidatus Levybacteria bacterium]